MRPAPLLAAATAALLLAGCTPAARTAGGIYPDPVEPTSTGPGRAHTPAAGAEDAAGTPAPGASAAAGGQAQGDTAACMLGDWDVPNSAIMAGVTTGIEEEPDSAGASPQVDVQGSQWARIDPAVVTTTFDGLVIHITVTTHGHLVDEYVTFTGSMTQPYTVAGDVMTTGANDAGGLKLTMTFALDGRPVDYPGEGDPTAEMRSMFESAGGSAQVTCTPTTLHQVPLVAGQDVAGFANDLTRR